MDVASYLYPWDVLGDPAAAPLLAGQGLDHVIVAANYHAVRALTPRHPGHRVVLAPHSAAYYPTSTSAWRDRPLRPPTADWLPQPDAFDRTVADLAAVDLPVHAWVVLMHRDLPAGQPIANTVINAYADSYSWALCPSQPAVRDYARILAAEVAARAGIAGLELEACGWYGFEHLSSHDKTAGVSLSAAQQYLFSLCFCVACGRLYQEQGIDVSALAARVRAELDAAAFRPEAAVARSDDNDAGDIRDAGDDETAQIAALLGVDLAAAVARMRGQVADGLLAEVATAVRSVAPDLEISLHADPRTHRSSSFAGIDPVVAASLVDRLVTNCWEGPAAVAQTRAQGAGSVVASLLAVRGMGGRPDLFEQAERAREAGADGIRLYHAGLATDSDLAAMAELTKNLATKGGLGA